MKLNNTNIRPLTVDIHLKLSTAKPTFISGPEDTTVAPGDPVTLRCIVEGIPEPTITWTKGVGHELPEDRYV